MWRVVSDLGKEEESLRAGEVAEKMIQAIKQEEITRLLQDLIRIPSHYQSKRREKDVAEYIFEYLDRQGIEVLLREVVDDRPNIIARIPGSGDGKSLLLNGHTDTVPPHRMEIDPFNPIMKGDRLFGRGSVDMKGALASMIAAILAIKRSGLRLKGDVYFTGVIGEELNSEGTKDIVRNGPKADMAIVGEPTELQIALGHKGLEWIEVIIKGRSAHSGNPEAGINAISKAAKFIHNVEEELIPQLDQLQDAILGRATLNFGRIEGGEQPSTVAGECKLQIDRRWLPQETLEMVYEDFHKVIQELAAQDPEFQAEVRPHPSSTATPHMPVKISSDHPLVQALARSTEVVVGKKPALVAFPAWTDASLLSNLGGIDSVVFGPGSLKQAHSAIEYTSISQVMQAAKIYVLTALEICGKGG